MLYAIHREEQGLETASLQEIRGRITSPLGEGDEENDDDTIWLSTWFEMMSRSDAFSGVVAGVGSTMKGKPKNERGSIISTAVEQTAFLDSAPMQKHLAGEDLRALPSLRVLKQRPTTIYLVLPASRMATHFKWLRIILTLALATLENEPHKLGDDAYVLFVF